MRILAIAALVCSMAYLTQAQESTNAPVSRRSTNAPAPKKIWTGTATNASGAVLATITMDTTGVPDLDAWGQKAAEDCVKWYPILCDLLNSPDFKPYSKIRLRIKNMRGVAATGRDGIDISAGYVRQHTNDFGMVIHELTHVVQAYPSPDPGWVTEGIADYVRIAHFEPQAPRPRIDLSKATYHDSYKTSAMFLEWVEKKYDKQLITKLNRVMRESSFKIELFKDYTGKTVDELWKEYTDTLR
jgi:hypothetical protein